jgi:hypothetical protein
MNELDLRSVDLVERHAGLARLNLRPEGLVKLIERSFLQIHKFRQV